MNVEVKYTYQDLLSTPEDNRRYEIFEGELIMSPAPNRAHQKAHANLFRIFSQHVHKHSLGEVYSAPFDVYFDEETVVEPDILFISKQRLHIVDESKVNGAPDLVVEIISPSSDTRDRGFKFKLYAEKGVKEYWLPNPDEATFEIYVLGKNGFELAGKFTGEQKTKSSLFPGLEFSVSELWK